MKKIILLLLYSITTITSFIQLNAQTPSEEKVLKNKIDTYLTNGISNGFSGAVLVAKEGEILLNKAYGFANKEKQIPYTTTTIATIGSVTKQFTATAILKLVEQQKLQVEDSLSKFFNNIPKDKKDITIHQLLTHTSGFSNGIGEGDFDYIPTETYFKRLFTSELKDAPGRTYRYSNAGYSILARIIELVSGIEYEQFLNKHLFTPAKMTNTGYFIPDWSKHNIASGYAFNVFSLGTLIDRFKKQQKITWNLKGNGGIHSTTKDMYKWYTALKTNKILSKALFEKLTTAYVAETKDKLSYYAYGWAIYNSKNNTKIISHNGGNNVFFHDFIWLPKEDVLVLLFTNASSSEVEVTWPIQRMILDSNYHPKPIKKNLFYLVHDFIKNNSIEKVDVLSNTIKTVYKEQLRNSNKLNDLGYMVLNKELIQSKNNAKWAISLFKLNTELFPNDGNIWDSLGEGYTKDGQIKKAIKSYKRALELGKNKNCNWCESSREALKLLKR
ncbi:serine hydrolase [Tenacibaculum amylolyticum]|uniref:serine hydrolase n=1 Tax=Tenacibaculum amylolyticum TaxID=104269 RepID=UPI003896174F